MLSKEQPALPANDQLGFRGITRFKARGQALPVQIDPDGRPWALMEDLLRRYYLSAHWDADQRRVLIAATDVAPTCRDDALQATVGWPLVEMALQSI
mgnify:CR=1 FL=1